MQPLFHMESALADFCKQNCRIAGFSGLGSNPLSANPISGEDHLGEEQGQSGDREATLAGRILRTLSLPPPGRIWSPPPSGGGRLICRREWQPAAHQNARIFQKDSNAIGFYTGRRARLSGRPNTRGQDANDNVKGSYAQGVYKGSQQFSL